MSAKQQMRPHWAGFLLGGGAMSMLGICKADSVQVFPEPWQVLEPGTPMAKHPQLKVLLEGSGRQIEPGDLVQLRVSDQAPDKIAWRDRGDWWLWIGFVSFKETNFYAYEPAVANALIGLKEGSVFEFTEAKEGIGSGPQYAGKMYLNVFGDTQYYRWRKTTTGFVTLYVSDTSGLSKFEVRRVCKGKAQYRTVRLFDDSWVQKCTWAPISCEMTKAPREAWMDEARIEAVCSDGKTATFQYGPIPSRNGKPWIGPVNPENYFIPWEKAAWEKLPVGVQLK